MKAKVYSRRENGERNITLWLSKEHSDKLEEVQHNQKYKNQTETLRGLIDKEYKKIMEGKNE